MDRHYAITTAERKQLMELLSTASSINRDYLRHLDENRRDNGSENYIGRFQKAYAMLEAKGFAVAEEG